jgi:phosphopantothenoylcysteine decarboxylase/phosphopantothenate--cysteine ligase
MERNDNPMKPTDDHPSKELRGVLGNDLLGKRVVLCITGSVAAYKAIDLARMLIRYGADVFPVMSQSCSSTLINPEIMRWATGNEVVTRLTGNLEHIRLADFNMSDLVVAYPCTANTIGKLASGIDDTPVTSILSVALGSNIPVIISPAMHQSLYNNKVVCSNIQRLKELGIMFLGPKPSEGKAKVVEPEQVIEFILDNFRLNSNQSNHFIGKNILVTAGGTVEHIDPVRVITNLSSGKLGISIALEAGRRGANVTLIYGHGSEKPSRTVGLNIVNVDTSEDMYKVIMEELSRKTYEVGIFAAAVCDYTVQRGASTKIGSGSVRLLRLSPTKKIIDEIKKSSCNTFVIGFKAEYDLSNESLIDRAFMKLKKSNCDLIVANDIGRKGSEIGSDSNEGFVIDSNKNVSYIPLQTKAEFAKTLLDIVEKKAFPEV